MKKLLRCALIAALLISLLSALPVLAADCELSYKGRAEGFIGGVRVGDAIDLFGDVKSMMPGDVRTQGILLKNDPSGYPYDVKFYLRAIGATSGAKLLDIMQLTVRDANDSILSDGAASHPGSLSEWHYLGTLKAGESTHLSAELTLPITAGNEFQDMTGVIRWELKAEDVVPDYAYTVRCFLGTPGDCVPIGSYADTAPHGEVLSINPPAFEGFTPRSAEAAELTVSDDPGRNVVDFYYRYTAPVIVTVTGSTKTVYCNSRRQSVEGYTVSIDTPYYHESDFRFIGEAMASGRNIGTYYMELRPEQFLNLHPDTFTNVYVLVYDGYIVINWNPTPAPTPTPDPTPTPTASPAPTTKPGPGAAPTPMPSAEPESAPQQELPVVTPTPEIIIEDEPVPMASASWALLNLLLMLLTIVGAVLIFFIRNEEEDESMPDPNGVQAEEHSRSAPLRRMLGVIPALLAIITFILTEDMRLPMCFTDRWTLVMLIIAALQTGMAYVCYRIRDYEDED